MAGNQVAIREDIMEILASEESGMLTSITSIPRVYFLLVRFPDECWESAGVLLLSAQTGDRDFKTPWALLAARLGPDFSPKATIVAMRWMSDQGILKFELKKDPCEIRIEFEGLFFPE